MNFSQYLRFNIFKRPKKCWNYVRKIGIISNQVEPSEYWIRFKRISVASALENWHMNNIKTNTVGQLKLDFMNIDWHCACAYGTESGFRRPLEY